MNVPTLENDDFFHYMIEVTGAKTYLELFGGTGERTIRPLVDICEVTTAETNEEKRQVLRTSFPNITVFENFQQISLEARFDLVCADPYIGSWSSQHQRNVLTLSMAHENLKSWPVKGLITYAPHDIEGYVRRCNADLSNVPNLEDDAENLFGSRKPTLEDVARVYGGELVAIRKGNHDLIYAGFRILN